MTADGSLIHKYDVARVDGAEHNPESKHFGGCFVFVLDLDHDPFAYRAVSAYVEACRGTHPDLASALRSELMKRATSSCEYMQAAREHVLRFDNAEYSDSDVAW